MKNADFPIGSSRDALAPELEERPAARQSAAVGNADAQPPRDQIWIPEVNCVHGKKYFSLCICVYIYI